MNETQILEELISFYESRGTDLHRVLSDPMFSSLPLQAKISTIKIYADRMAKGTPSGYSSVDKKNIGWSSAAGAVTGAISGFQLARAAAGKFVNGATHPAIPIITAAAGALIGGAIAGNKYLERVQERRSIKRSLENVAKTGTDSAAFRTLALNNLIGSKYDRSEMYDVLNGFKPMDSVMKGFENKLPPIIEEHNVLLGKIRKDQIKQETH